jgi:hypothetical protein
MAAVAKQHQIILNIIIVGRVFLVDVQIRDMLETNANI